MYRADAPLVAQGDRTVLLEVHAPAYEEARDALCRFAELEKSPEHVHTYRISALSLWNAASAGLTPEDVVHTLERHGKYALPPNLADEIRETMARHGRVHLVAGPTAERHVLRFDDDVLRRRVQADREVARLVGDVVGERELEVPAGARGPVKRALTRLGYPVEDDVGFRDSEALDVRLRGITREGLPLALRAYQREAAEVFWQGGSPSGGHGVVVLPCGAGKTLVGLAALSLVRRHALVLVTNVTAARQWIREILDKTTLTEDEVGEYSGESKELRPVTVATYQVLTWRKTKRGPFPHFAIFESRDWGLVIHDEVHLLPAPVFRATADLQACRRLGLTATLVREDGLEADVFSLIGPKRFDVPWKDLERQGFIAVATCREVHVDMPRERRLEHATAEPRHRHRLAAENPAKLDLVKRLAAHHAGDRVLVIGQYLDQLERIAEDLRAPLIIGRTPQSAREELYDGFRSGEIPLLVVSKVANFAVDLPEANVAIQVSGTYGSRQEEAQRLGRILRPHGGPASLYSLVSRDTVEQDLAMNRRRFLTEQGYSYRVLSLAELEDELAGYEEPAAARPPAERPGP